MPDAGAAEGEATGCWQGRYLCYSIECVAVGVKDELVPLGGEELRAGGGGEGVGGDAAPKQRQTAKVINQGEHGA